MRTYNIFDETLDIVATVKANNQSLADELARAFFGVGAFSVKA